MKPGPRIIASQAVTKLDDITDEWKVAAYTKGAGDGTIYWEWPIRAVEQGALRMAIHGARPTLSCVQWRQAWNGAERWVLYVRRRPGVAGRHGA